MITGNKKEYVTTNIGIIGNGFVGNAIANGFQNKVSDVRIYDVDKLKSTHGYVETISSDYIFVCLPTPMTDAEGGACNLSIIKKFFDELPRTTEGIIILKSTVPIGTTQELIAEYPFLKIIHNPEFLTAVNAEQDFIKADRHVIGGEDKELVEQVERFYKACFPEIPVYSMKTKESEAVKYFANSFLAAKVMIFNEMKVLCDNISDVDYDKIIEGVVSDNRIGHSHTYVPGPDGDYGFGGTCFPKDVNALIHTMEEHGINPLVLKSVWEQNKNYRGNWDWVDNTSAVLSSESSDDDNH